MLQIFILSEKKKVIKSENILEALHPQAYSTSNAPEIPGAVEMEEKDTGDNTRHSAFALTTSWCEGSVASNLACLC